MILFSDEGVVTMLVLLFHGRHFACAWLGSPVACPLCRDDAKSGVKLHMSLQDRLQRSGRGL